MHRGTRIAAMILVAAVVVTSAAIARDPYLLVRAQRRTSAAFEQSVLDRIGRSDESFAPGNAAVDIKQPTLLLWGRDDTVVDPSAMDLFAGKIPQASKVLLDDCGHMSLLERLDAVARAVDDLIMKDKPR